MTMASYPCPPLKAGSSTVERFVRNASSTPPGAPVELRARSLSKRHHQLLNSLLVQVQLLCAYLPYLHHGLVTNKQTVASRKFWKLARIGFSGGRTTDSKSGMPVCTCSICWRLNTIAVTSMCIIIAWLRAPAFCRIVSPIQETRF